MVPWRPFSFLNACRVELQARGVPPPPQLGRLRSIANTGKSQGHPFGMPSFCTEAMLPDGK